MPNYRVEVSHSDADHPNSAPAHYGPAYNDGHAELMRHALDVDSVDLLAEARKGADRARKDYPKKAGYTVRLVEIVDNGDGTHRQEEVK